MPISIQMTDFKSPPPETQAGVVLTDNMKKLSTLMRVPQDQIDVTQDVDVLMIDERHQSILKRASMVVMGSPAPHSHDGCKRTSPHSHMSNVSFKQAAFYSVCWHTPPEVTVAMTWSASACDKIEFWADGGLTNRRLTIEKANFDSYRPRKGLSSSLEELSYTGKDTMVAICMHPRLHSKLVYEEDGVLNGSATFAALAEGGHLLSYATYTAELELDIINAACRARGNHEDQDPFQ